MKYITDVYALNIPCSLKTSGDWHEGYNIKNAIYDDTDTSFYKEYGIEKKIINNKEYYVANHLRAILDMLYNKKFDFLKGFRKDFLVVDIYDNEFFNKVYEMKDLSFFNDISNLMGEEYTIKWLLFLEGKYVK